jgi:hypothetical protein
MKLFPSEKIRIVFAKDLAQDPQRVVSEIWSYLGVDPTLPLANTQRRNVAESLRSIKIKQYTRRLKLLKLLPLRVKKRGHQLIERLSNHAPSLSPSSAQYLASH